MLVHINEQSACHIATSVQGSIWTQTLEAKFFLRITQVQTQMLNTHAHSTLWTHIRKPYLYEHLQKTVLAHLEIDEVTIGASLSMGTSPTTKRIVPLNPEINPEKCEHPCQAGDLNSGGQVPLQWTQPVELRSIRLKLILLLITFE